MIKSFGVHRKLTFFLTLFLLGVQPTLAEPAYWFKWQSKLNGKMICKQLSPGEGWQQHAGPFYDAQCRKPVPQPINAYRSALNN